VAVEPDAIRRGSVVLVRVRGDKARPAVVVRSDLLAELPYATVLPITSELRADASMRLDIEASPETGLRVASQVMVDWPQTIRLTEMGQVIGRVDMEAMRAVTRQLAIVLGIGGTGKSRRDRPA
jgi:mRNA interferase MazF